MRVRSTRPCTIDDCDTHEKARGWCYRHYRLWKLYGDPNYQKPKLTDEDRLNAHGTMMAYTAHIRLKVPICEPCRNARRVYAGTKRPYIEELATYESIHKKLQSHRGSATAHTCPCGKRAEEWAHIQTDQQVVDKRGRRYSRDIQDYEPRCVPCHRRMDRALVTHCPQGHEYDEANTYVCSQGKRQCRACAAARARIRSEKKRTEARAA